MSLDVDRPVELTRRAVWLWTDGCGRHIFSVLFRSDFSAPFELVPCKAGGRTFVGRAGEFSLHPFGWRTNRELEGRTELVGRNFSTEEKDVLSHIYDSEFEQMLGVLKQAEFSWIWVSEI